MEKTEKSEHKENEKKPLSKEGKDKAAESYGKKVKEIFKKSADITFSIASLALDTTKRILDFFLK